MTTLPTSGYLSDATITVGQMKTGLENVLSGIKEIPGGTGETAATLASNAFTPVNNFAVYVLDTSGGGPTDTLKTINVTNVRDGQIVYLRITNDGRTITVHNAQGGTGQIFTQDGADTTLTDTRQFLALKYNATSSAWEEVGRSQNIDALPAAGVNANTFLAGDTATNGLKSSYRTLTAADIIASNAFKTSAGWNAIATTAVTANVITPTQHSQQIDTSSAAQTVNQINNTNFSDGRFLLLTLTSTNNTLTLTNGTATSGANLGMILKGGVNCVLTSTDQSVLLQRQGTIFKEVARYGFSTAGAVQGICQFRLTLATATPSPNLDASPLTAQTTLYFSPWKGNQVATYNGTVWNLNTTAEKSISLSTILKNVTYDVFLADGALSLSLVAWASTVATNNPVAGSNVTINVPSTTGMATGDWVNVRAGSTSEMAQIASFVTGTSVTVATLANSYTTPTVYINARATALTLQDGVWLKNGDLTKLFVGTIRGSADGQCEMSKSRMFVSNAFNPVRFSLKAIDPAVSVSVTSAAFAAQNANVTDGQGRLTFVSALGTDIINAELHQSSIAGGSLAISAIGLNSTSAAAAGCTPPGVVDVGSGSGTQISTLKVNPGVGTYFVQALQGLNTAGSATVYLTDTSADLRRTWMDLEVAA